MTVCFAGFETKNRSHSLKDGTILDSDGVAVQLLKQEALTPASVLRRPGKSRGKAVRLIGLRLEQTLLIWEASRLLNRVSLNEEIQREKL